MLEGDRLVELLAPAKTYELGVDVKTLYWIRSAAAAADAASIPWLRSGFRVRRAPVARLVQIPLKVKIPQHGENRSVRFTEQMTREMTT